MSDNDHFHIRKRDVAWFVIALFAALYCFGMGCVVGS